MVVLCTEAHSTPSTWLLEDGAVISAAMVTLLVALETDGRSILVIDVVEQGLDRPSQEALMAYLRRRQSHTQTLFLLTRSNAILDLEHFSTAWNREGFPSRG